MTVDELKQKCHDNLRVGCGIIMLTLPTPKSCRGYTLRLCGTHGPRGEIVNTNQQTGISVVRFKVQSILNYIEKHE